MILKIKKKARIKIYLFIHYPVINLLKETEKNLIKMTEIEGNSEKSKLDTKVNHKEI